jgi:lichenan operon transcriptional antiterminator
MNAKYTRILHYLRTQQDWTSSSQIADSLGISKRSIKTYISELNNLEKGMILSSKKGYLVEPQKVTPFLTEVENSIPQTPKERVEYVVKRLLNANGSLKLYELVDELFVSDMTLKGDLRKVKKRLAEHQLELICSRDLVQMAGLEKNKRKLMSSLLYRETNEQFLDMEELKKFFKGYDVEFIRDVVVEAFSTFHYFTNDFSLTNVILHLAIAIDRMKNGFIFSRQVDAEMKLEKESTIAHAIAEKLEDHFGLDYTEEEIRDLSLLISSSGTSFNFMHLQTSDLYKIAGARCLGLVEKILEDLRMNDYVVIDDSDFLIRFTLHIKNLLMRLENRFISKNPLTSTIKLNCPSIYDCAVHVSYTIKEETGFSVCEDEIAYIAFHLGYALEIQKQSNAKITCSILFPFYYNYTLQVAEKISRTFSDDLLIQHIVTNESDLDYLTSDFIISTVQLNTVAKVPSVIIDPFFTGVSEIKVRNKIKELKERKQKNSFKRNIEAIMDEQLFEISSSYGTKEETLSRMCAIMQQKGFVDAGFLFNVLEREEMSSTAFGRFAIPHAMKMNAEKTGMFALLHEKGLEWGGQTVHLVLLFSVNKDDTSMFHEVVDSLATILTEEKNLSSVLFAKDYSSFVEVIVQSLNA